MMTASLKRIVLLALAVCPFALLASCEGLDGGGTVPEDLRVEFPEHVLAGERLGVCLNYRIENPLVLLGDREFEISTTVVVDGKECLYLTVPEDFQGTYKVSVRGEYYSDEGDAAPADVVLDEVGSVDVYRMSGDEPDYSLDEPVSVDLEDAVMLVGCAKVTKEKMEKARLLDKDGKQVNGSISSPKNISHHYCMAEVEYYTDYEIEYPDNGEYLAYRRYTGDNRYYCVIRNSDGRLLRLQNSSFMDELDIFAEIRSAEKDVFYFLENSRTSDRNFTSPLYRAEIYEDYVRYHALEKTREKIVYEDGYLPTPDGKVYINAENILKDGELVSVYDLPPYTQVEKVLSVGNDIIILTYVQNNGWRQYRSYRAVADGDSYSWKFIEGSEFELEAFSDIFEVVFAPDAAYIISSEGDCMVFREGGSLTMEKLQNVSSGFSTLSDYTRIPDERYWYYFDLSNSSVCRIPLDEISVSEPQTLDIPSPSFMFHSVFDTAVVSDSELVEGQWVANITILDGGNKYVVWDYDSLLEDYDIVAWDSGAIVCYGK